MPRVLSLRQRLDLNVYDAFSPRDLLGRDVALFGAAPKGIVASNSGGVFSKDSGGVFSKDNTSAILTWYARTNMTLALGGIAKEWDAWTHATTVTLIVGTQQQRQRPLVELLGPRVFGSACGNSERDRSDVEKLAAKMFSNYQRSSDVKDGLMWTDLSPAQREVWLAAASVYPFHYPVRVRVMEACSVLVQSDTRALEALLRVMPEDVAPCPLVWIHLDGVMSRALL